MGMLQGVAVHHARGGSATTLVCLMHTGKGCATPQAGLRVGHKFGCVFWSSDNPNSLFSSHFLLQLHQVDQINSNNFSFANVPTPPSVQHLVHVY
jgi:hypothetical protein